MSEQDEFSDLRAAGIDTKVITETLQYFNAVSVGRSLTDVISDVTFFAMAIGFMKMVEEEIPQYGIPMTLTRAIAFGIFLGETGKSKLIGERTLQ
jgi:hypothetical protein